MTFGSVCSGILGAELAFEPLGWEALWCSEIANFPCRVIAHQRKGLPNLGDFTAASPPAVKLLVGGTPCQTFSCSGNRAGLGDPRGNLALQFAELAVRVAARWVVWENVPGVLSVNRGTDFRTVLRALVERGYYLAYRRLDAQFFGLAQRRARIILVGYLGDWRPPAAVLFERPGLPGDTPPQRKKGAPFAGRPGRSVANSLGTNPTGGLDSQNLIAHTCTSIGPRSLDPDRSSLIAFDPSQITSTHNRSHPKSGGPAPTLLSRGGPITVSSRSGVRKLTPLEYERLQGFPDGWTDIPGASDTARYKAVGNAFPVPMLRWVGERICVVDQALRGGGR